MGFHDHAGNRGGATRAFGDFILKLAEAFPTAKLTPSQVLIYARALGDIDLRDLRAAGARAVRECRFFPSVAELRSFVAPSEEDAAVLAWSALGRAAEDVGAYASLELEDGYAAEAVARVFGSWAGYCEASDVAVASRRQEFLAAYREARRRRRDSGRPARLRGLCDEAPETWRGRVLGDGSVTAARGGPAISETGAVPVGQGASPTGECGGTGTDAGDRGGSGRALSPPEHVRRVPGAIGAEPPGEAVPDDAAGSGAEA